MDYQAHYERLISRARSRTLEGYRERHHIIPRCMGGTNAPSNIVELTAEEHYLAHQLLVKIHPQVRGLAIVMVMMSKQSKGIRAYGWLRRKAAASSAHPPEVRAKMSATRKGRRFTEEHKAKISAALLGNRNGFMQKPRKLTTEHRAKLSAAKLGRTLTEEHRRHIGIAHLGKKWPGRKLSEEHKAKISVLHAGSKRQPETIAKMAAARRAWWERRRAAE